ncbi:hypothetical protein [Candidatus Laterigemmans baculatus]|uniref:hypothetical protein n=1 Tax=Candidatus Laterigemmans baculatus TaxID=2770505 RepID=UPI0013DBFCE9|nr:hypothetical protein [Candidatus Laterigemmans baculatus]
MSGELEDFLRRAAQRRAENAAARKDRPQPPRRPEYTQRDRERVMTSSDPDEEIVVADLVPAQPVEERRLQRTSVGQESAEAIRRKLKAKLEQASAKQSRQGHAGGSENRATGGDQGNSGQSTTGQGVGMLGQMARKSDAVTGTSGGSPALQAVLRLIHDPHGVDQAILAREILDRPTHRWE